MDSTSACNLHCTGCWAAAYGNKTILTYEELDNIINQANAPDCYFFLYTDGEPLVRKATQMYKPDFSPSKYIRRVRDCSNAANHDFRDTAH